MVKSHNGRGKNLHDEPKEHHKEETPKEHKPKEHHTTHKAKEHHATHKHAKPTPQTSVWQFATTILAILLIISIFTNGFGGAGVKDVPKTTTAISTALQNQGIISASEVTKAENAIAEVLAPAKKESTTHKEKTSSGEKTVDNALPVELYVMSKCPYGVQAENTMFKAIQDLGENNFDLNVNYIANNLDNEKFQSLHGSTEVDGDMYQLCAREQDPSMFLDLVSCMDKDPSSIPGNWKTCAADLGYDTDAIETCFSNGEGAKLLKASIAKSNERQVTGSPTIYINNKAYSGGREVIDFKRAFCNSFDERPAACADIPEPVKFEVVVLNDKTCTNCDTAQILGATKGLFPGAQIRTVDVSSKEGQNLIKQDNIEVVPAYFFEPKVVETDSWKQPNFDTNFDKLSDGSYKLKDAVTGASYYVSEEKRQAKIKAMGITTGDNKPQLDFFVMSFCPYGNSAEQAIAKTYAALKGKADFKPHYIYYENYQGGGSDYCLDNESKYCSMHGATEARENIREQCVEEQYGLDAWFDFALKIDSDCTTQNVDTCYVNVAKGLGYDVDAIKKCFDTNALTYAAEDARLMKLFGASGSPSVYIDGQSYSGPRTGTGYEAGLCNAFDSDKPSACDGLVVQTQPAATTAPQGQC